jgi:hypothetical protein
MSFGSLFFGYIAAINDDRGNQSGPCCLAYKHTQLLEQSAAAIGSLRTAESLPQLVERAIVDAFGKKAVGSECRNGHVKIRTLGVARDC